MFWIYSERISTRTYCFSQQFIYNYMILIALDSLISTTIFYWNYKMVMVSSECIIPDNNSICSYCLELFQVDNESTSQCRQSESFLSLVDPPYRCNTISTWWSLYLCQLDGRTFQNNGFLYSQEYSYPTTA